MEAGTGPAHSLAFWWPWAAAPTSLTQPINPGWTFGNVIVNERNSSAPATEMQIVAEESYGRQIGKLLDAVVALIGERGTAKQPPAMADLVALQDRVERIKTRAALRRLDQVQADLRRLREHDRKAYDAQVASFRRVLANGSG
jgi:hypothetical protein